MMPTKLTLPAFLSGSNVPHNSAGSKYKRDRHADSQGSFSPLLGPGIQRWDTRLDGQTWHTCLRWYQRLRQWYARHFSAGSQRAVPQRLDDQRDVLHEGVRTPIIDGCLDCIARTHPSLRMVIYTSLA
jgi:hypothetical protein